MSDEAALTLAVAKVLISHFSKELSLWEPIYNKALHYVINSSNVGVGAIERALDSINPCYSPFI